MKKAQTLEYLLEYRKELQRERMKLYQPIMQIEKDIDAVSVVIAAMQRKAGEPNQSPMGDSDFPINKLRSLTQVQALIVIAKHYGGTFKAQEAKRLLIRAGVMRETKNSTNIIHSVIRRSEKFDPVKPGEYRLKSERTESELKGFAKREGLPFNGEPVQ